MRDPSWPPRGLLRDVSFTGPVITGRGRLTGRAFFGTRNYGAKALTGLLLIAGRRRLRDQPPYGTAALTGRLSLRDSSYGTTGRRSSRDEPPYGTLNCGAAGRGLRDESPYKDSIRDGGAYGTPPYGTLITGRKALTGRASYTGRRLDEPHGTLSSRTEALTGRASLWDS